MREPTGDVLLASDADAPGEGLRESEREKATSKSSQEIIGRFRDVGEFTHGMIL